MKETVSDWAREARWEFDSKGKVQHIVIFREDLVGGRARVTIDEERVL